MDGSTLEPLPSVWKVPMTARMRRGHACSAAAMSAGVALCTLLLAGCSEPQALDSDGAKRALLTASEMPGPGWSLDGASATAPPQAPGAAPTLASGACQDALRVIDAAAQGAPVYVKGTYSQEASAVVDIVIQSFDKVPDDLSRMRELVAACPSGQITSGPTPVAFRLESSPYPESGAAGATLTVAAAGGPQVLDVAVLVRDHVVVTATGSGPDPATIPGVLDQVLAAQDRKIAAVSRR